MDFFKIKFDMAGMHTNERFEAIEAVVAGRVVYDLGAGDCSLSARMLTRANRVVAVDRAYERDVVVSGLELRAASFEQIAREGPTFDVAVVSWPINYTQRGLLTLVKRARVVIYLGSNLDGSACGTPDLFESFLTRELIACVPDPRNTLLILGGHSKLREPTGEERAGMDQTRIYSYEEAWHGVLEL